MGDIAEDVFPELVVVTVIALDWFEFMLFLWVGEKRDRWVWTEYLRLLCVPYNAITPLLQAVSPNVFWPSSSACRQ